MLRNRACQSPLVWGVAVVLLTGSLAAAQEREGRRRGGFGFGGQDSKVALLRQTQVREELKLSDDQQAKLREAMQSLGDRLQDVPREERREKLREMAAEAEKTLGEILTAEQTKRLDEIALQAAGVDALRRKEVAEKLSLSDDQQQKIRQALQEQDQKRRELFQQARGDGDERPDFSQVREKMQQMRQEAETQVLAVLTAEQKQQFEQMKGKPVELRRGGGDRRRENRE